MTLPPRSECVTVYFDYLCPFAWRGAELTHLIAEPLGLHFRWHHFSLYQSNYSGDDNWQLWNEKIDSQDEYGSKGLLPFLASCAARKQGDAVHQHFRLQLMRARHHNHQPFVMETMLEVAKCVGLHLPSFEKELANPECRTILAQEHHRAKAHNVFGTPTFHFCNDTQGEHLAYLRIKQLPQDLDEALGLFRNYREMLERYPYVETIKRPRQQRN